MRIRMYSIHVLIKGFITPRYLKLRLNAAVLIADDLFSTHLFRQVWVCDKDNFIVYKLDKRRSSMKWRKEK